MSTPSKTPPTQNEKRIKIAEACGWMMEKSKKRAKVGYLISPDFKSRVTVWKDGQLGGIGLPDYFNDLNAMHEAEKALGAGDRRKYTNSILGIGKLQFHSIHATAAQRAEAFGEAKGLWP